MSWYNYLKVLFSIEIFFGLCNGNVMNKELFKHMTLEEKRFFFGTEDGTVPDYQMVNLLIPSRSKRSIVPPIAIHYEYFGKPATTILNVVQDHNLIGRSTTGIWTADSDENGRYGVIYTPRPDIFDLVGEYDLFQNTDDCSALTRFVDAWGGITISGILRQTYVIKSVPLCDENGVLVSNCYNRARNGRSANSNGQDNDFSVNVVIFQIPEVPMEYLRRRNNAQRSAPLDLDLHRKKRQNGNPPYFPNTVFPKLLIIPDYSVIRDLKVVECVRQLIAHVNAVDMMYRQLHEPEVRLTISGIILPRDFHAASYIASHVAESSLNADNVLNSAVLNFIKENFRFPYDLHNAVVILTTHNLYSIGETGRRHESEG